VSAAARLVAAFGAFFVVAACEVSPFAGDFPWQRRLGEIVLRTGRLPRTLGPETLDAAGAPWTPQEWLFGVIAAHAGTGAGYYAFCAALGLCAALAVALCAARARARGANAFACACVVVACGIGIDESFAARAQVIAWLFFVLVLFALETDDDRAWFAVPLAVLWANVHASVLLAPLLAGLRCYGAAWEGGLASPAFRRCAGVTAATALAVLCTPLGADLPRYAIALVRAPYLPSITEWRPSDLGDGSFLFGALPVLAVLAAVGLRSRRPKRDVPWIAAFAFLLFGAERNIAIATLLLAPIAAESATRACAGADLARFRAVGERYRRAAGPLLLAATALFVGGILRAHPPGAYDEGSPAIVAALRADGAPHRVVCTDFAWCNSFADTPGVRTLLDGRVDPFPPHVWDEYATLTRIEPGWEATLARLRVDAVLAGAGSPLDQALATRPDWRIVRRDGAIRLWMPTAAQPFAAVRPSLSPSAAMRASTSP